MQVIPSEIYLARHTPIYRWTQNFGYVRRHTVQFVQGRWSVLVQIHCFEHETNVGTKQ